jgi:hypothetical protein
MDPDPALAPDPTTSSGCLQKLIFCHTISYNLPTWTLSSVIKKLIFCKIFVLIFLFYIFFFASIISACSAHLWKKGKDPDPYLWPMNPVPILGGPKTCESGSGSGSPTLIFISYYIMSHDWLTSYSVVTWNQQGTGYINLQNHAGIFSVLKMFNFGDYY